MISWELALLLPGSQPPVLALTALLVTQLTLVKTICGFQRVASVTAGVLLALLVADVLGLHWWSVELVIFGHPRPRPGPQAGPAPDRGARSAPCSS